MNIEKTFVPHQIAHWQWVLAATDSSYHAKITNLQVDIFVSGGGGSFQKITAFTQIRQISELTTQGGEQQYANFSYLEETTERQMPTTRSPRSIQFNIGDDQTLASYRAAKTASDSRVLTPLRIDLPNGGQIYFNGYASLNEMPSMNRGKLMTVQLNYAVAGEPNRYNS